MRYGHRQTLEPDCVRAMPLRGHSGVLRIEPSFTVSARWAPAVIARGPSDNFIRRGRNPEVESPWRFEPTAKGDGDVVI